MKCLIVQSKPYDEKEVYRSLKKFNISTTSLATKADFILAIGGDGAVIKAFHETKWPSIPILGYNTGTLGFLSSGRDLNELLDDFVNNKLVEDKRFVLQIDYDRDFKIKNYIDLDLALNEIAFLGRETGKLVELDMTLYGETTTYKGDGLIIATPTGSTAYNLSVGGPILEPWCDDMVISPISPFSMSSRPLVVKGDVGVINITGADKVLIDGRIVRYPTGSPVEICLAHKDVQVTLLKQKGDTFYKSIKSKLGWEKSIK